MRTDETLVMETSSIKVKITTVNPKRYKSPGIDHMSAELIQAGGNTLRSEIHRLINSVYNNTIFFSQR
jgi:hypothetical protein